MRQTSLGNLSQYLIRKAYRPVLGIMHLHHILPKSFRLGGETDKANQVFLTIREHFVCHRLLVRMLTAVLRGKMIYALHQLSNSKGIKRIITGRVLTQIYEAAALAKLGEGNGRYGKLVSKETRDKISQKNTGYRMSDEARAKLREVRKEEGNFMFGKKHSAATRQKIRDN